MTTQPGRASFYEELLAVLQEINAKRPLERHVSLRSAVVNGMTDAEGKGLADSFCSKLRSGAYRPTYDRIRHLAEYLGIKPTRFSIYRERVGERLLRDDPEMGRLIEVLSHFDEPTASMLLKGAHKRVKEIIQATARPIAA